MMETESCRVVAVDAKEIGKYNISNRSVIKHELETEAEALQKSKNSFPFPAFELDATIKVENSIEGDADFPPNIVNSELVQFHNTAVTDNFNQNYVQAVIFEKIPKEERKIFDEKSSYFSDEDIDLYNNADSEMGSNFDHELDPFADVDCDPRFSQTSDKGHTASVAQVQSVNTANVNSNTNTLISRKNISPSAKSWKKTHQRSQLYSKLQCQLCLVTHSSESKLKTHVEICAASHKNRRRFCIPCNKLLYSPRSYRDHVDRIHRVIPAESQNPLRCQLCLQLQSSESTLETHVEICAAARKGSRLFCVPCNKQYFEARYFRKHVLNTHGI